MDIRKIAVDAARRLTIKVGFDIVPCDRDSGCPVDFDCRSMEIWRKVRPYTMTSPERINAVVEAVRYLVENEVSGDFVECGVWRGGASMAMAYAVLQMGCKQRDIHLYDTFCGMTSPEEDDVSYLGESASLEFSKNVKDDGSSDWCAASLDEVRKNLLSTGYCADRLHFIEGRVEDTIPKFMPKEISLLRLDTDWYASTKHEMDYLFPLLKPKGVLIIDDYGYWKGSKKAIDEYIKEKNLCVFLSRTDSTGRVVVKA